MRTPFAALLLAAASATVLAACNQGGEADAQPSADAASATEQATPASSTAAAAGGGLAAGSNFAVDTAQVESVAFTDVPATVFQPDGASQEVLTVQVMLDRARFSPGVIDGRMGENVRQAIAAYERANGLSVDGQVDPELVARLKQGDARSVLRRYTITEDDVNGPFVDSIPEDFEAKAKLERLGYTGAPEMLAEKFHMDVDFLRALNPGKDLSTAGTTIVVADRGSDELPMQVARIEVDKGEKAVRAYDAQDKLIAFYPATIGSEELQSPDGVMKVRAIAPDPKYYFDPEALSWGPDKKLTIAAGPNNPVGTLWIDLEKEGYGIHGTPEPAQIGKTSSHGCVRLTNWDAEELASQVKAGVTVAFTQGGAGSSTAAQRT